MSSFEQTIAPTEAPGPQPAPSSSRRRRLILLFLGGVLFAGGSAYAYHEVSTAGVVSTDDAYVGADVATVTAQVGGHVAGVFVEDAQVVKPGQLLASLDPTDASLGVEAASASLARAERSVSEVRANDGALAAAINARLADAASARDTYQRRAALFAQGWATKADLIQARDAAAAASAAVDAARQQLAASEAQIAATTAATPDVQSAKAELDQARTNLGRTEVRAPIGGIVSQRSIQLGEQVAPGTAMMAIVPIQSLYVDANFTEKQLTDVRPGQPAILHADLYGSGVTFHGRVVGIGGGTGAAFALIPAQNATGNWIKVVQRVPVRIRLDPGELAQHPLRVGLSMDAAITTR